MTDIELGHHDVMFKSIYLDLRSNNFSIFIEMVIPKLGTYVFHLAKNNTSEFINSNFHFRFHPLTLNDLILQNMNYPNIVVDELMGRRILHFVSHYDCIKCCVNY